MTAPIDDVIAAYSAKVAATEVPWGLMLVDETGPAGEWVTPEVPDELDEDADDVLLADELPYEDDFGEDPAYDHGHWSGFDTRAEWDGLR